jgi:hypothetical protein
VVDANPAATEASIADLTAPLASGREIFGTAERCGSARSSGGTCCLRPVAEATEAKDIPSAEVTEVTPEKVDSIRLPRRMSSRSPHSTGQRLKRTVTPLSELVDTLKIGNAPPEADFRR